MNTLKNKVVVVTGGKGLLGTAFVKQLKEMEGIVIILDNNTVTDMDINEINCDITNTVSIQQAIDLILKKYEKIDGWVNNAYPRTEDWGRKPFSEESMESFTLNVDWHLGGYVKCCQLVLNQMKKQGSGSLINMASIYGVNGPDFSIYKGTDMLNEGAYAAIKGGVINFTRFLAAFYGPYNVRVNCVSPGGIFDNQNPIFVKNYEERVPMRRLGNPDDIAPSIGFLLSEDAKYITGQNLIVDGGWTAI